MKKEVYICNSCGKGTPDFYNERGWIHIDKRKFVVANERDIDGHAHPFRYTNTLITKHGSGLDFCSIKCFIEWMFFNPQTRNRDTTIKDEEKRFFSRHVLPDISDLVESNMLSSIAATAHQLHSVAELIEGLKKLPQDKKLKIYDLDKKKFVRLENTLNPFGSWRGDYNKPVMFLRDDREEIYTVKLMIWLLEQVDGKTVEGYKGGTYTLSNEDLLRFDYDQSHGANRIPLFILDLSPVVLCIGIVHCD